LPTLVSIVHNNVIKDSRVLKQAESLGKRFNTNFIILGTRSNNEEELLIEKHFSIKRFVLNESDRIDKMFYLKKIINPLTVLFLLLSYYYCSFKLIDSLSSSSTIIKITFFTALLYAIYFCARMASLRIHHAILEKSKIKDPFFELTYQYIKDFLFYKSYVLYLRAFEKEITKLQPDIIHAHDLPMLIVIAKLKAKIPKTKVVYDSHELFEHVASRSKFFTFLFTRATKKYIHVADEMITVSNSFKNFFQNKYKERLPNVSVVRNAVLKRKLIEPGFNKLESPLRKAVNLTAEDSRKILLYQGGITEQRGIQNAIQAFTDIDPKKWLFIIMGWGNYKDQLVKQVKKLNISDRVKFIPGAPLDELTSWTAGADVGIIPYLNTCKNHYYCSPNKLWEYPSAGLPFIAPAYPELKSTIEKYHVGWTTKSMSAKDIRDTINSITESDIKQKSENTFKYVQIENWETQAEVLVDVYKSLLR
jgi:glycosyltransferase involved in cell wall biosynthesis